MLHKLHHSKMGGGKIKDKQYANSQTQWDGRKKVYSGKFLQKG